MEKELLRNKRSFRIFNAERISRAISISPIKGKIAFKIIPFLIHTNLKGFPGFIDSPDTPGGICEFEWTDEMKSVVKEFFPDNKILNEGPAKLFPSKYCVESLLLMGSVGSIAQNEKSDYDYWVSIDESQISAKELDLLKKKLKIIEDWAIKQGVEIHFFPTDIQRVKNCDFGESDKESAGSSQGRILKEEFYRTSIFVSGKMPLWWIMPVGIPNDIYTKYKEKLKTSFELDYHGFVDLGNLEDISSDEYFGAALWQMNKAMTSPYKSVLKMALLESFIDPGSNHELLCNALKRGVFDSHGSGKSLDPYSVMINRVLNYYTVTGRNNVVELIRRCFYIKVGEKIKKDKDKGEVGYKGAVMRAYVENWGWRKDMLEELNNYQDWGFEKVAELGNQVHNFMIQTYKNLTDKLKSEADIKVKISDVDLTVLGRRLFSLYSKKPNKIDYLKRAFDEGLIQESLTFSVTIEKNRMPVWNLYRGQVTKETVNASNDKLLKKGCILDLVMWLVFNRLCDKKTSFYLIPNPLPVSLAEIQTLIKELQDFFPPINIADLQKDALLLAPKKMNIFAVINFSSQRLSEIKEVTIFYSTTWGELFCENYNHKEGIERVMRYVVENPPEDQEKLSDYYKIFIPKGQFSDAINREINKLILQQLKLVEKKRKKP
ncbi:MAG: class I adenylate cyclase [Nitrospinae bacterium]|nr:class I adenylate cyclase [Nitrospinota bacterium]